MIWVAISLYVLGAIAVGSINDVETSPLRYWTWVVLWPLAIVIATVLGLSPPIRDKVHQFLKGVRS